MSWDSDRTHVARLRVHSRTRDPLATRVRVEAMLSSATLAPPGLATSAILIVRRLRDPMPGKMAAAGSSWWLSPQWQGAVQAQMAGLMRQALRPLHGAADGAADAVLFDDEAELAACLVRDWLQGRTAERWWWTSVLGGLVPAQWLQQRVLSRGELLAPTIAVLARHGLAVAWLARLEDAQAEQALVCIGRAHALPSAPTPGVPARARSEAATAALEQAAREESAPMRRTQQPAALARLAIVVPEALAPALRPTQRRLLAVALALARAPAWARTSQLARALDALDRQGPADPLPYQVAGDEPAAQARRSLGLDRVRDESTGAGSPFAPAPRDLSLRGSAPAARPAGLVPDGGAGLDAPLSPSSAWSAPTGPWGAAYVAHASPLSAAAAQPQQVREPVEPEASVTPLPEVVHVLRVRTGFGGIFYLLNAALAMGWYSDFTAPRGPNLALSPWDWLTLVGRAWFAKSFTRDPVAGLLAQLAGREVRTLRRPRGFQAQLDALHTRLQQALGAEGEVTTLVCRHHAEVVATPTRVDVHLALAELPLALRLAGLDRDPGWIPAAGRALAFHFE